MSRNYQRSVTGGVATELKYYDLGGQVLAMRTNGVLSYILSDHLGSTTVTTDANGVQTSETRYTAFGEIRVTSGTVPTEYKYTGQLSIEVGLYFYVSRFFDPYLNHFVSADTLVPDTESAKGYDRYSYVGWNPLIYSDPTGHKACWGESEESCGRTSGSKAATENIINSIYDKSGILALGENWNLKQSRYVDSAINDMIWGINKITGGHGKDWIQKNLGGSYIDVGGGISGLLGASYVDGSTVHLLNNFEKITWENSIYKSTSAMVIHEFGHVWDNRLGGQMTRNITRHLNGPVYMGATWYGGGPGDELLDFVGGRSTKIFRFLPGSLDVPPIFAFQKEDGFYYGNNSAADYFAHSFAAAIIDPSSSYAPQKAIMWVSALIDLTK